MTTSRHWELRRRPEGWPVPQDVALVDADVPAPGPGRCSCATTSCRSTRTCAGACATSRAFDAAFDYKRSDLTAALGERCPDGIDVYSGAFIGLLRGENIDETASGPRSDDAAARLQIPLRQIASRASHCDPR